MGKLSRSISLGRREVILLCVVAALVAAAILVPKARAPISSAETRFVEKSAGGLQIVPASCESTPPYEHWAGECSGQPPEAPVKGCSIYADPSHIASGDSSTLMWSVGSYPMGGSFVVPKDMQITTIGSVSESGTRTVHPTVSTTYRLTGHWESTLFGSNLGSFSCSYRVTIDGTACPSGQYRNGAGSCVCNATGQAPVNGSCTPGICPLGQHMGINSDGNFVNGGSACLCDVTNAPPVGGTCTVGQCAAQYYCSGPDRNGDGVAEDDLYVINRNNMCSPAEKLDTCTWGCSGGGCVPAPEGSATLDANPRLLHSGDRTSVKWTTQNVKPGTCHVIEDNPEIQNSWSANSSATAISGSLCTASGEGCQSGAIHMQTHYTLQGCVGLNNQTLDPLTVEVNVIPSWEEQ